MKIYHIKEISYLPKSANMIDFDMESLSKIYFQYVVKVANSYGISTKELFSKIDIKDNRIEVFHVKNSIEYIIQKSGNINIPLEIGKQFRLNDTHSLMKAMKYTKTIASALKVLEEFHSLIHTGIALKIDIKDDLVLSLEYKDQMVQYVRFPAEGFLAIYLNMIRSLSKEHISPKEVCFFHPMHDGKNEMEQFFKTKVKFEQNKNYMVFDKKVLELYLHSYDKTLEEIYVINSKVEYDKLDFEAFLENLRFHISNNLFPNIVTVDLVAKAFHISTRTLQYRLKKYGMKFNTILNDIRKEKALMMINEEIPLCGISLLLGFQNQSAFTRSFKKWYGITPKEYLSR